MGYSKKSAGEPALSVKVHPELVGLVRRLAKRWRDRTGAGADGAQYSPELERAIAWMLELTDGDFDKIQREGEGIVSRFRALPADYDPETWEGERPLRRRAASVFAPESGVAAGAFDRPLGARRRSDHPKGHGHKLAGLPHGHGGQAAGH